MYVPKQVFQTMNRTITSLDIQAFNDYGTYAEEKKKRETTHKSSTDLQNITNNINEYNKHNIVPSIAFGKNTALPMHTDKDGFLSIVTLHCAKDIDKRRYKYKLDSEICKYFVFENNVAVGLRSGDVLIFNPCIGHCVSTLTSTHKEKDVICVSHYCKNTATSENDNSKEFKK